MYYKMPPVAMGLVVALVFAILSLFVLHMFLPDQAVGTTSGSQSWHEADDLDVDAGADDGVSAAVDAILASRGEHLVQRPVVVPDPGKEACEAWLPLTAVLPTGTALAAEEEVSRIFKNSSGFWTGSKEAAAINEAVDAGSGRLHGPVAGPGAHCIEATYGEITVEGLNTVLTALSDEVKSKALNTTLLTSSPTAQQTSPFDAFVDLGAGVGRTATAAALLGFTERSLGVELGRERFSLGCAALQGATTKEKQVPLQGAKAKITLFQGDIRQWAALARKTGSDCSSRWVFYIGAECFRDALLSATAEAVAAACPPGIFVAVLGRRLPQNLAAANGLFVPLRGGEPLLAKTTWNPREGSEVFLYRIHGHHRTDST